jgi:hypothetical protein
MPKVEIDSVFSLFSSGMLNLIYAQHGQKIVNFIDDLKVFTLSNVFQRNFFEKIY